MVLRPPRSFWLPKAGNSPEEYEDASRVVYPQRIGASGRRTARVAVADGASESAFAREWANVLVGRLRLPASRHTWAHPGLDVRLVGLGAGEVVRRRSLGPHTLARRGESPGWCLRNLGRPDSRVSGRAVHGVCTGEQSPWEIAVSSWSVMIRLLLSFPLEDAAQFDNSPALVCSNPDRGAGALGKRTPDRR